MGRYEIRIAGIGGQGAMLAGVILAEAAVFYEGKYAIQSPTYTSQVRGGPTKADVVISDEEIIFPRTTKIDFFLSMAQITYDRYCVGLKDEAIILLDSNLVPNYRSDIKRLFRLPIVEIAKQELGKVVVANIVALGAVVGITEIVSFNSMEQAVLKKVPQAFMELNKKALTIGYERAKALL